ncbi:hypothetical protein FPOAC1_000274 [Fusarium poae]|uniref:hypothetical protein n=1 Tax=Fusarium poae TaxID=36050 RepID=UPI001CE9E9CA|nr:hypothetical protein FPOAC1_000274 [Fusarium poae]KAG8674309.1 hypothetical protein FPOAC1_000274 [Fusarium poae]
MDSIDPSIHPSVAVFNRYEAAVPVHSPAPSGPHPDRSDPECARANQRRTPSRDTPSLYSPGPPSILIACLPAFAPASPLLVLSCGIWSAVVIIQLPSPIREPLNSSHLSHLRRDDDDEEIPIQLSTPNNKPSVKLYPHDD